MVLEASSRRRISDAAVGLRQRAELTAGAGDLTRLFANVDTARREVEALHQREAAASGALSPTPINVEGLSAPLRQLDPDSRETERLAVLSLVENPAAIEVVKPWLKVKDFRDDECALHFGELLATSEARVPIDRLTLAWALAQRGVTSQFPTAGEGLPIAAEAVAAGRQGS